MELRIKLPQDIGEYIAGKGRVSGPELQEKFKISNRMAFTYAAVSKWMTKILDDPGIIERMKEAKIDFTKTTGEGSACIDATVACPSEMLNEEGAVTAVLNESGMNNPNWIVSSVTVKKWTTTMKVAKNEVVELRGTRQTAKGDILAIEREALAKNETPTSVDNWSVKIKFRPNENKDVYKTFELFAKRSLKLHKPLPRITKEIGGFSDPDVMGMLMLADVHFGKHAWCKETGIGDMDLGIVSSIFDKAVDALIEKIASDNPGNILIPIGNDLLHFENRHGKTTDGGNNLDTDSRLPKVMLACMDSTFRMIDIAMQIAPVELMWVPGNHDYTGSLAIMMAAQGRYGLNPHVTIDLSPEILKARLFGETLLGFTHDMSGAKMTRGVETFKSTFRKLYGQCTWNEIFTGHLHKKSAKTFGNLETIGETVVHICSSLSTVDMWHLMNFFTDAVPAGEAYSIHKKEGVTTSYRKNIDYRKFC